MYSKIKVLPVLPMVDSERNISQPATETFITSRTQEVREVISNLIKSGMITPQMLRGKAIDAGCGMGVITKVLKDDYGIDVTSVDSNQSQLNQGITHGLLERSSAVCANIETYLASVQDPVDVITFFGAQKGVDVNRLMTGVQRTLKPNGVFLMTTDELQPAMTRIASRYNLQHFKPTPYERWDQAGFLLRNTAK